MIRTLRRKFVGVTMAIVTVFLIGILGSVVVSTARNLERESVAVLRQAVQAPMGMAPPGQKASPYFLIRITSRGQSAQAVGGFDLSDSEQLTDILAQAMSAEEETGVLEEHALRYCRKTRPGELVLVFADTSAEQAAVKQLVLSCAAIGGGALILFWGLCILLAWWAVRPVERAWEEQRRFIADASHELKTPLAVIMTNAELLQDPAMEPERRSQSVHSIQTMSRRMRTLVEGLLELARMDNGAVRAAFAELELSALVEEELLPFEPVCFEEGLELDSDLEPGLWISGSDAHLRQVAGILLDNAIRYCEPKGTIRLRLRRQGSNALLTVENPGRLSREECQNIFRRFYRVDKARTGGGYGLGLPIALGIVTDHGGRIWAESQGQTVKLNVQLPLVR